tara:strand:+ start:7654 stop:8013 length:360 start_codon:yes stop_codon:yes gene_type:complete
MISGLKFPVQINTMGRFAIVEDDDKIKQNARAIINTRIKERYYEPTMGRSDVRILFSNIMSNSAFVVNMLKEALNEQEPRAVFNVSLIEELGLDGKIVFGITYQRIDKESVGSFDVEVL